MINVILMILSLGLVPQEQEAGSLVITTDPPGADVYVDEQLVGKSPVTIKVTKVEKFLIKVYKLGYASTSSVIIAYPGERTVTKLTMVSDTGPRISDEEWAKYERRRSSARSVVRFGQVTLAAGLISLLLCTQGEEGSVELLVFGIYASLGGGVITAVGAIMTPSPPAPRNANISYETIKTPKFDTELNLSISKDISINRVMSFRW